jgi:hypothetical protein
VNDALDTDYGLDGAADAVALALGALLALAAAATLVGTPWQQLGGAALAAVRVLGSLLAVAVGAALAWLAATE